MKKVSLFDRPRGPVIQKSLSVVSISVETTPVQPLSAGADVHRKHLNGGTWPGPAAGTASGRAAIAAELASLKVGDNRGITPGTREGQMAHPSGVSIEEAAEAMNVGPRSVKRAKQVMRENPAAVKRGESKAA